MTEFIFSIIISSLWIFGINCLFSEGHIFERAGDWIHNNMPEWVYKPTVGCPACQSSLHGLLFFIVVFPVSFEVEMNVRSLIPFLICLCGLNFIILKITNKERIILDDKEETR